jgi:recombination protein RecA
LPASDFKEALSKLKKSQPEALYDPNNQPDLGVVSTGSIAVDAVTVCGGFPRGRITEVSGWESSGKTTLLLAAIAALQREGGTAVFLDMERALDMDFAARIGCNFDQKKYGFYFQPDTLEGAAEVVETMIETGAADLVAVDSVSALIPKSVTEGEVMDKEAIALRARLIHTWIPRLVTTARRGSSAVVLINQLREVIPTNTWAARFGPKTKTSGGSAMRFWPSLRLQTRMVRKGNQTRSAADPFRVDKEIDIPVANEHAVESDKNKVGSAYREAPFWIRYDDVLNLWGVDNLWTLMDMSIATGTIKKKAGGYFEVEGTQVRGTDLVHKMLLETPEIAQKLADTLGLNWKLYAPHRPELKG